jgi:hypothetical protein
MKEIFQNTVEWDIMAQGKKACCQGGKLNGPSLPFRSLRLPHPDLSRFISRYSAIRRGRQPAGMLPPVLVSL